MNIENEVNYPAWILAILGMVGLVGTAIKKLFVSLFISRGEYESHLEAQERRFVALETDRVTRADFKELARLMDEQRESFSASMANVCRHLEGKLESFHGENRETITHMSGRIDAIWERRQVPRES